MQVAQNSEEWQNLRKVAAVYITIGLLLMMIDMFQKPKNIVCYFMGGSGKKVLPPEDINPNLCTHINYAFVDLDINGNLKVQNPSVDIDSQMYERVIQLKKKNSRLKVLLSTGPVSAKIYSAVAENPESRNNFVVSCEHFLNTYGFDGIDIDWESPTSNDTENLVALVKDINKKFVKHSWILTMAVMPLPKIGYDAPELTKYVDMFNIMTYNFYGPWSAYTGQNSPLYGSSVESSYEKKHYNLAASVQNWINIGVPKEKINAGMAFYGRTYTLLDASQHGLHAPFNGTGKIPTPTYFQICTDFTEYIRIWDDEQKNPYKYKDDQWLSYDDEESIREKAKYIVDNDIGGAMIWQIAGDDVLGKYGKKQKLLHVIHDEFKNGSYFYSLVN